jgi:CRISPR type IV-associated protein Csf3
MTYHPLRITAYLQSPVVSDERLPLDGVLLYFLARQKLGFQPSTQARVMDAETAGLQMPFAPHYRNVDGENHRFLACSFACWVGTVAEGRDYWVKRFDSKLSDVVDFAGKRGRIDTKAGRYRGYRMPVYTRHALAVRWYCVGDRDELTSLLRFCTHLGKKESQGYGAVLRWEIERWPRDWSIHSPRGLMRAIPSTDGILAGFRAPYWLPENQTTCALPDSYADPVD